MRKWSIEATRLLFAMVLSLLSAGCASTTCCFTTVQETDSAIRYFVLGFGIISVPKPKEDSRILAVRTTAIGLVVTNQPGLSMGLGYSSSSAIVIPGDTNGAVVEISTCTDGGISAKATSGENN